MPTDLNQLLPQLLALLAGGIVGSFAPPFIARRPSVRTRLGSWSGTRLALVVTATLGVVGSVAFAVYRTIELEALLSSPGLLAGGGLGLGLVLSLPSLLVIWHDARAAEAAARQRKQRKATPEERLEFAQDLVRQIVEFSPRKRHLNASLGGEKQKILVFEGDLEREEADKLVQALKADLKSLGFRRLEGEGANGKWWSRV